MGFWENCLMQLLPFHCTSPVNDGRAASLRSICNAPSNFSTVVRGGNPVCHRTYYVRVTF